MSKVVHYLDCGCAIREDGSRSWCPSCSSPPAPKPDPMAKIAALLSGTEWTPDTLDEIADIVRATGYEIKDI